MSTLNPGDTLNWSDWPECPHGFYPFKSIEQEIGQTRRVAQAYFGDDPQLWAWFSEYLRQWFNHEPRVGPPAAVTPTKRRRTDKLLAQLLDIGATKSKRVPNALDELLPLIGGDAAEAAFCAFSDDGASPDTHWINRPGEPPVYARGDSHTVISVGGPPQTSLPVQRTEFLWDNIVRGLMNDETRKTFAFVLGRCIGAGGDTEVRFEVNDLLAFRGTLMHQRAYRPEDKRDERDRLWALTQFYIQVDDRIEQQTRNGKVRSKTVRLTSALITVGFEDELALPLEQLKPQDIPYGFRIRLGSWATPYIQNLPRYVAPLFAKVGKYRPGNPVERIALRLALFLSFKWMAFGRSHEISVADLLRIATIPLPKNNPERFRDNFEAALTRLHGDGVIGGWQWAQSVDEAGLPSRKWFAPWLRWTLILEAPAEVLDSALKTVGPAPALS